VYYIWLEHCCSTARVATEVAARVLPEGHWILICMLGTLGSSLLLSCIVTLGYCIKQLGSWILGAVEAGVLYIAKALP
jgi:hypothetical protein